MIGRRQQPPPARLGVPFYTGDYLQEGGGILDWFQSGWNSLANTFRSKALPALARAAKSPVVRNLASSAKQIAKDTGLAIANDALSGKNVKKAVTGNTRVAARRAASTLKSALNQSVSPSEPNSKKVKSRSIKAMNKRLPLKGAGITKKGSPPFKGRGTAAAAATATNRGSPAQRGRGKKRSSKQEKSGVAVCKKTKRSGPKRSRSPIIG